MHFGSAASSSSLIRGASPPGAPLLARDIWIASPSGHGKPFAFLATPFREGGGRFSPDGKWIAYTSDETGRVEVYVRRFSGQSATEGRIQVSKNGGEEPV
jgi:Tol biopolymer transport system component